MATLNTFRPPTQLERDIAAYINRYPAGDFEAVLGADKRREVFYHLSPMRAAIISWYPFAAGASVLEWGGEMGALSGALCDLCADVCTWEANPFFKNTLQGRWREKTNLRVRTELPEGERFDYIFASVDGGVSADLAAHWQAFLKPAGRLLLALPNRFGLQNWCGGKTPAAELPFDDVAGRSGALSFAELSELLKTAGFPPQNTKVYYPARDHLYTQEVFSNDRLPGPEGNFRHYPMVRDISSAVLDEAQLLPEVIRGGAFAFFSNSFFVECRMSADVPPCDVEYATLTLGRPAKGRFATVIRRDTVEKISLHPDAKKFLARLMENETDLRRQGIPVVPCRRRRDRLVMPRIPALPWLNECYRQAREGCFDEVLFLRNMDRLVRAVRSTSKADPPGTHGWPEAFGPVMHRAYPELVPANCFYDERRDELLFFDQEFVRDNCPASVVVFRALFYLEKVPPVAALLPGLKERYGIAHIWDALKEEESRFLGEIFGKAASDPFREELNLNRVTADNRLKLAGADILRRVTRRGWQTVAIYGNGLRGRRLRQILSVGGVRVLYVIDRQVGQTAYGAPVVSPEELPAEWPDGLIVSLQKGAVEVAALWAKRMDCPVVTLETL